MSSTARGRNPFFAQTRGAKDSARGVIQAVIRASRVLFALVYATEPRPLGELSHQLGLHKTTVLRLLRTLMADGMVSQDPATGGYLMSPGIWIRLAPALHPARSLLTKVQELLDKLAAATGGTAMLVFADVSGRSRVLAAYAVPPLPVHLDPSILPVSPLHASAAGKVYLAHQSEQELAAYCAKGLSRVTARTITYSSHLRQELVAVRRQGYALNRGENVEGVPGVGIPLRNASGWVVGGLSLAFAGVPATEADLVAKVPLLTEAHETLTVMTSQRAWKHRIETLGASTDPLAWTDPPDPGFGEGAMPKVRSVSRALRLLGLLIRKPAGLSLREIARHRQLHPVTARRLLHTLITTEVISYDVDTGRYLVDPLFWIRIAPVVKPGASLTDNLQTVLQWLADATGATASFVTPDLSERFTVTAQYALPASPVCFHPDPHLFPPLHVTAAGRCYLAHQSPRWVNRYIKVEFGASSSSMITDPASLLRALEQISACGYALDSGETEGGVGSVAVPLAASNQTVLGALVLSPLLSEMTQPRLKRWLPQLQSGAHALQRLVEANWRQASSLITRRGATTPFT